MNNRIKSLFWVSYKFLVVDVTAWALALPIAALSRFEFNFSRVNFVSILFCVLLAGLLQMVYGLIFHLYRGRSRPATFEELQALFISALLVGLSLFFVLLPLGSELEIPRGMALLAIPIFIFLAGGTRAVLRRVASITDKSATRKRTLVYGAGSMAESLIPQLLNDPKAEYLPVGIIDDSPQKQSLWINNVPVLGTFSELTQIVNQTSAELVIVCIASSDAPFLKKVEESCRSMQLKVVVLPTLDEVLQGRYGLQDLRSLSIEDVVGRRAIDTEVESISSYLRGKKVLVTGAGGSIGSELCRQISRFEPAKLIMLDRDESGLQQAQIQVSGHGLLDTNDVVLADIRDLDVLQSVFIREQPDVVFHAAALKHLPMLEQYPDEAWKTNVLGTLNVLKSARMVGVKTLINISTDKAADPTSVLGASKKLTEGLTSWFAQEADSEYLSVRFGNVLGSRGSLLPTFTSLIERGGPLTITHPEVTRFFMTIPEACQLVLQAGALGRPQDVLVLDMGQPVKIIDIANKMIEISGKKIEIVFTGLRPGEKLHEDLYGVEETGELLHHNLISRSFAPPVDPEHLKRELLS